jgi:hypothetical protein
MSSMLHPYAQVAVNLHPGQAKFSKLDFTSRKPSAKNGSQSNLSLTLPLCMSVPPASVQLGSLNLLQPSVTCLCTSVFLPSSCGHVGSLGEHQWWRDGVSGLSPRLHYSPPQRTPQGPLTHPPLGKSAHWLPPPSLPFMVTFPGPKLDP